MAKKIKKNISHTTSVKAARTVDTDSSESVKKPRSKEPGFRMAEGNFDNVFLFIVIVLVVYGLIMMFSASYMEGLIYQKDGYYYIKTQLQAAVIGIVLMYAVSTVDYHLFMNSTFVIIGFLTGLALLTYTSIFGHGTELAPDAKRWINIGSMSFQASEAMKPILIVFLAFIIVKNYSRINDFKKISIPLLMVIGPIGLNMALQRHFSGLLIMAALFMCVIFLSGMKLKYIVVYFVILAVSGTLAMLLYSVLKSGGAGYIITRVESFFSSDDVITDKNWQVFQSLIAIGSGGWFGLGFGESRQKYLWLPESQNDFIIAIIVEELGYIGGLVVLILFALFIIRGFRIARKAPDKFGMLIVGGITFQIGFQALLNIAVSCKAFPNTGVPLPFFSSGGTALLIQIVEMGVILSVSRSCNDL